LPDDFRERRLPQMQKQLLDRRSRDHQNRARAERRRLSR
jgi:hypothetical protein